MKDAVGVVKCGNQWQMWQVATVPPRGVLCIYILIVSWEQSELAHTYCSVLYCEPRSRGVNSEIDPLLSRTTPRCQHRLAVLASFPDFRAKS